MKASRSWLFGLLAAAGLVLASGTAQAQLDKCQQGIEKEAVKIQALILKALQLCKDKYRQTVVKVQTKNLTLDVELPKVTKACDTLLAKTIGGPLTPLGSPPTQVQKTYDKLSKLYTATPQKCSDQSLAALGHLPQGKFGDAWIRWLITAMLKAAYEKQVWIVADTPGIMNALCDANGNGTLGEPAGTTGDCPTCCKLKVPPCNKMNCRLAAASTTTVTLLPDNGGPGVPLNLSLGKEVVSEYCQYPDFIGSDIAVVGNPSRTIDELNVGGNNVCVTQLRATGFIKCGPNSFFTGPKDVDLCVDAAAGAGACNAGNCLPPGATAQSCPSPGTPGPTCQDLSGAAAINDTVILSTLQIESAPTPCTGAGGNVVPTVLTTGTVNVTVSNYDNAGACNASFTSSATGVSSPNACGAVFLDSQDLGGTTLVGGFPALDTGPGSLGDLTTVFSLVCEP